MLQLLSFTGEAPAEYIEALARLRIEVFREYPYLYDGDMSYERSYLRAFLQAPDSLLLIVLDGQEVVGASTAMPLQHETANIRGPLEERGYDASRVFYFGESVLRKACRGQGMGARFFEAREAWARQLKSFGTLAFCAVERPGNHPRRPPEYRPLHAFWRRQSFGPTDIFCHISWKELGEEEESPKPLRFWLKDLK